MANAILYKSIVELLGINELSQEEQSAFLAEIGDVILDTAITRLILQLTDEQQTALEQFLDENPSGNELLIHLLEHYKQFESILEDVIVEFKEDAEAVMPK